MWAKHEKMEMSWDNSWKIGRVYQAGLAGVPWKMMVYYKLSINQSNDFYVSVSIFA